LSFAGDESTSLTEDIVNRLRIGLLPSILIVFLVALDLGVIRALRDSPGSNQERYLVTIDSTHWIPFFALALGVLPMASVLVAVTTALIRGTLRTGTVSSSGFGFVAFGWISVFATMCATAVSPPAVQKLLLAIEEGLAPVILPVIGDTPPDRLIDVFELSICVATFFLPQLAIALVGYWLIGRSACRSPYSSQAAVAAADFQRS
jgi:hypothetical protein